MASASRRTAKSGSPHLRPVDPASADLVAGNIAKLRELFPELLTEAAEGTMVNVDGLKQLVGDRTVTDAAEKFGLNWHGKRQARQLALTPSAGTLRPAPADSVEWETTRNLMIEGDNLEVLKLLQKSYAGKVKLIYIDPPYNTGSDFVYPDSFQDSMGNYLEVTGQTAGGEKISSYTEAVGRYHTDWLNMIYPRLRLARDLLGTDGVIFVSVDDHELERLKLACDEIFGEENSLGVLVLKNKAGAGAKPRGFIAVHEYVLCYARNAARISGISLPMTDEQRGLYSKRDEHYAVRGPYGTWALATTSMAERPNLRFPIVHDGEEIWPEKQWLWNRERVERAQLNNELVFNRKRDGSWSVRFKRYLNDEHGEQNLATPTTVLDGPYTHEGTRDLEGLIGKGVFSFPKPVALLTRLLALKFHPSPMESADIVLDFFAGSGTTGHAVMQQNVQDGGSRRYILVQLPELLDPEDKEQKVAADFCDRIGKPRNIAEITKERLRRAAKKIKEEHPDYTGDLGFRVFKLDSTNIRAWDPDRENIEQTLLESVEHIKGDRSDDDVLYELLLKLGLDLATPIETKKIAGHSVQSIGVGTLLVCLSKTVAAKDVEPLALGIAAWHAEQNPAGESTVVFRDSAFADDVAKTNLTAILEQHGLTNVRSL